MNSFKNKRLDIIELLNERDDTILAETIKKFKITENDKNNRIYISKGHGKTGVLKLKRKMIEKAKGLFRFIIVQRNGQYFCLNFMRFYIQNQLIVFYNACNMIRYVEKICA